MHTPVNREKLRSCLSMCHCLDCRLRTRTHRGGVSSHVLQRAPGKVLIFIPDLKTFLGGWPGLLLNLALYYEICNSQIKKK